MKKTWCVYIHTNTIDGKKYVGITSQKPEKRWSRGGGYSYNPYFYNAILKYGWDSFLHDIVEAGLCEKDAKEKEKELIRAYNTMDRNFGYNLTEGGDGALGRVVSEETKIKISEKHIGMKHSLETRKKISESLVGNNYALGSHHSEETRKILSERMRGNKLSKGNKLSEETRRKMSKSHIGKKLSDESRRKISEANSKRTLSDVTKDKISKANRGNSYRAIRIDMSTKDDVFIKTFSSAKEAAIELGIDHSSITKACRGLRKTAGGYTWKYHTGTP